MNRLMITGFCLLLLSCEKTIVVNGNEGAYGGDSVQVLFKKAQSSAVNKLRNLNSCALRWGIDSQVKQWIIDHRLELIADLEETQHQWQQNGSGTCARTGDQKRHPIQFSYNACKNVSEEDAFMILIHESVHHFGIEDEDFPTKVALEVFNSTRANCIPHINDINWLDQNISAWPETANILSWNIQPSGICYDYSTAQAWPEIDPFNDFKTVGNYWVIANLEGEWYASTHEWIIPAAPCESNGPDKIAEGTRQSRFHRSGFKWVPKSGELVGLMISTPVRFNFSNGVEERSPILWVRWP